MGLGTIGLASAGAGLGTTAYFSDEESFDGNSLTAGELDLRVGYTETYTAAAAGGTTSESTATGEDVAVSCGDSGDNTPAAKIELSDVKPGDEGHVDFDFWLCSNPGYVWFYADLTNQSENGTTEPEADAADENDTTAFGRPDVELLDAVEVTVENNSATIFDSTLRDLVRLGNPEFDGGVYGIPLDGDDTTAYDEALRASGSRSAADSFVDPGVNTLWNFETDNSFDAFVQSAEDPAGGSRGQVAHATSLGTATNDYVTSAVDINTDLSSINTLSYDYYAGADNQQAAPDEVYLLLDTDSGEHLVYRTLNDNAPSAEVWETRNVLDEINSIPGDWKEINDDGSLAGVDLSNFSNVTVQTLAVGRGNTRNASVLDVYYDALNVNGTLQDFPTTDTEYADGARDSFAKSTEHDISLSWNVPTDVGNEIQGDSVTFDLGFYTEQARHNSGSGI